MKIAVLEDDIDIRELIAIQLNKAGLDSVQFEKISECRNFLEKDLPHLLILDLMLPDGDGLDFCKILRNNEKTKNLPIIILTAKSEEIDKILGLEFGADDYITKPFSQRELIARIKSVLRRSNLSSNEIPENKNPGIIINKEKYEVLVDNKKIDLTTTEFKILKLLCEKKGWVFSRNQILDYLWGNDKIVIDRTIDVHIKNLREKLGPIGSSIKNIRGVGYKFEE